MATADLPTPSPIADPTTDRAAWLEWRRQGLGASDVAGVLGISPWSSPWSVWADKVGLLPPKAQSEPMEAGHWLERAIAPWFADRTGLHVYGVQTCVSHPEHPWQRCTLDGFVTESYIGSEARLYDPLGLLEIKAPWSWREWVDGIPPHYQAQAQWQLHVTGHEHLWFAVLHGRRLATYELERDQADIDLIVERASAFWHEHVLTGVAPEVDGSDATYHALARVYPEHTPGTSIALDDLADIVAWWKREKRYEREAKRNAQGYATRIEAALGEAEEGTIDGQRVVSWRNQTRKSYTVPEATFRALRAYELKEAQT